VTGPGAQQTIASGERHDRHAREFKHKQFGRLFLKLPLMTEYAVGHSPRGHVDVAHHPDCHSRNESRTGEHPRYDGRAEQNHS
jgi:hypothetical protein